MAQNNQYRAIALISETVRDRHVSLGLGADHRVGYRVALGSSLAAKRATKPASRKPIPSEKMLKTPIARKMIAAPSNSTLALRSASMLHAERERNAGTSMANTQGATSATPLLPSLTTTVT